MLEEEKYFSNPTPAVQPYKLPDKRMKPLVPYKPEFKKAVSYNPKVGTVSTPKSLQSKSMYV